MRDDDMPVFFDGFLFHRVPDKMSDISGIGRLPYICGTPPGTGQKTGQNWASARSCVYLKLPRTLSSCAGVGIQPEHIAIV